jgi:hypothetical protein
LWQGRPIVSSAWVQESTTSHSRTDDDGTYSGYGYLWWIATYDHQSIPQGSYAASGYGGHTLQILPDLNTVIVIRPNTDESIGRLQDTGEVDRLVMEILKASSRARGPHPATAGALLAWGITVAGSMALLLWNLVRDKLVPTGVGLVWTIISLFFGPLGPLAYWLLVRRPARRGAKPPAWQRALGATLCGAAGNILGLLLLLVTIIVYVPSGSAGPLVLVAPFLAGWLGFCAPLLALDMGHTYWLAARKSLLVSVMSTVLVAAGAVPVVIVLNSRWYPYLLDLAGPYFWAMHTLAAIAGALVLYPFNLWMTRRGLWVWPAQNRAGHLPKLPSLQSLFLKTGRKGEL